MTNDLPFKIYFYSFVFVIAHLWGCSPAPNTDSKQIEAKKVQSPPKFRILILGDSLTEGYGVSNMQAFPFLLETKLNYADANRTGTTFEVVNAGISGSTTSGGVSRIKWLLKSKPDLLIVALGANDGLRGVSVSEIKKNLKEIILAARKNDIVTLLAGMKMPPNYGTKYTNDFSQVFQELANEQEVPLIPFLLEGVGGEPSMNLPDGIHPNPEGHDKIAQTVYDHVIKLLPQS